MKLLKLIFWLAATVILAYFMTDLKWGGKSFKQHIDDAIHSEQGHRWREAAGDWIKGGFKLPMREESLSKPLPQAPKGSPLGAPEEISIDNKKELEKVMRDSR